MLLERGGRRLWSLLLLLLWQYLHGVAVHAVYFLHRPGPLLRDMGFELLPALDEHSPWRQLSEVTTFGMIGFGVCFLFAPFFQVEGRKTFFTVNLANRTLLVLMYCQALRVLSFFGTVLPGPNYHCREGSPSATLPPPHGLYEVLWISGKTIDQNCGDLIFSSHTIFLLVFLLNYQKYGRSAALKRVLWVTAAITGVFIIASRKHYTVDIVIAWYTVPLVYWFVDRRMGDRDVHGERLANLCVASGALDSAAGGLALYALPKGKGEGLVAQAAAAKVAAAQAAAAQPHRGGGAAHVALDIMGSVSNGFAARGAAPKTQAMRVLELLEENRLLREELSMVGGRRHGGPGSGVGSSGSSDGSGSGGESGASAVGRSTSRASSTDYYGRAGRGMHRREPSAPDLLAHFN